jgi:hypothetical protein
MRTSRPQYSSIASTTDLILRQLTHDRLNPVQQVGLELAPASGGCRFRDPRPGAQPYFRCCARYLFISNIVTLSLPKIGLSLSSARISRRFSGF